MESITNAVNSVGASVSAGVDAVSKTVFGEEGAAKDESTTEPVSGVQGAGTLTEPFDQGNNEAATSEVDAKTAPSALGTTEPANVVSTANDSTVPVTAAESDATRAEKTENPIGLTSAPGADTTTNSGAATTAGTLSVPATGTTSAIGGGEATKESSSAPADPTKNENIGTPSSVPAVTDLPAAATDSSVQPKKDPATDEGKKTHAPTKRSFLQKIKEKLKPKRGDKSKQAPPAS